ncbi:hypothetical protein LJR153_007149 [Paenibacillus sp. LjRoot153]
MSVEKLIQIESQCRNPQDAIIIRLFLESIEVHEIVYLKKQSLEPIKRILTITDSSGRERQQFVSTKCVELYQKAINQKNYLSKEEVVALRDTDYLVKVSFIDYVAYESMIQDIDSVILRTIYKRLHDLAELNSFPELTYLHTGTQLIRELVKI